MIKYRTKMVQTKEVMETVCDRCDKVLVPMEDDFIEIRHEYGYGSKQDGTLIEFDLCEACFEETITKMHINVRVFENGIDPEFDGML